MQIRFNLFDIFCEIKHTYTLNRCRIQLTGLPEVKHLQFHFSVSSLIACVTHGVMKT